MTDKKDTGLPTDDARALADAVALVGKTKKRATAIAERPTALSKTAGANAGWRRDVVTDVGFLVALERVCLRSIEGKTMTLLTDELEREIKSGYESGGIVKARKELLERIVKALCRTAPVAGRDREKIIDAHGRIVAMPDRQYVAQAVLAVMRNPKGLETIDWEIADVFLALSQPAETPVWADTVLYRQVVTKDRIYYEPVSPAPAPAGRVK